jgi:hypothetical protein
MQEMNGLTAVDGVIVANDGDRLVALNIGNRVAASYNGLSDYINYSPEFGCQRA